jgi:DNA-directed RNA polymerase specialized sigma24 family protein
VDLLVAYRRYGEFKSRFRSALRRPWTVMLSVIPNQPAREMSDAFTRRYRDYVSDVYGYFAYRLGSRAEAERLTQATFERAFRERTTFGSDPKETSVRLLTIARETGRGRNPVDGSDDEDLGIETRLAAALAALERGERAVIALRYGARLASLEIARVLGLSEDWARRTQSRGLRRLRTELESRRRQPASDPAEARSVPAGGPGGDHQRGDHEQREAESDEDRGPEPPVRRA